MPFPPLVHDPDRLAALDAAHILDTAPEQGFDDIVRLAARLCATPAALVSLVAGDRQWFKARLDFPHCQTDLNSSVCAYALGEPGVLVIPDLAADARTLRNPLVTGEPFIRFYAGAPLRMPGGAVLGSLCVIDRKPRPQGLTPEQIDDLEALARQVVSQIELRRTLTAQTGLLAEQAAGLRERDALAGVQAAIGAARGDPDTILDALVAGAMQALPAAEAAVLELIDGDALEYRAVAGTLAPHRGLRVPLRGSLAGACALTGTSAHVNDILQDDRASLGVATKLGLRSALLVPVARDGQVLGILKLQSSRIGAFGTRDLQVVTLFAGEASAGLTAVRASEVQQELDIAAIRQRAVFDSATEFGIIITDRQGRVTDWNSGAERMLGWSTAEMRGQTIEPIFTPEDRAGNRAEIEMRRARAEGHAQDERWHLRKDGSRFWASGQMMPLRTDAGAHLGYVKILRDQTEQRDAYKRLEDSQTALQLERGVLQAVLHQAPIGISIAFADGRALINEQTERMMGHGVGATGDVRYEGYGARHADGRPYAVGDYPTVRALRRGEVVRDERMRYFNPTTSQLRRWEVSSTPVRDPQGGIIAAVTVFADVEDRLGTHEALQASEERLSLALAASGSLGWYDWDIPRDRFYANEAFARMFGVPPEKASSGAPLGEYIGGIHPDDRDRVAELVQDAIAGKTTFDTEYRVTGGGGPVVWAHSLGRIHYRQGQAQRCTGILVDVTTARLQHERQTALLTMADDLRDVTMAPDVAWNAGRTLGTALGAQLVGYGSVDADAETITVERDWTTDGAASLAGTLRFRDFGSSFDDLKRGETVVVDDARTDLRTQESAAALEARSARSFVNMPVFERGRFVALLYVSSSRARVWSEGELIFIREVAERVRTATARLQAEEQQQLINHELSHRLKNVLAMAQAIATQTLRNATSVEGAKEALTDRLVALARAQDALQAAQGSRADMATIIGDALALHDDHRSGRFALSGPRIQVEARAALPLALMIHELATNAAKYGALSVANGHVLIEWLVDGPPPMETLRLVWREQGGPPVTPPTRKGFGSRLIERGLTGAVGGSLELSFPTSGVTCTLSAPLSGFQVRD